MTQVQASVTFRHIPASSHLTEYIQEQVEVLEAAGHRLTRCHVVIEPERHPSMGMAKRCRVHVTAHVPGRTLNANRMPRRGEGHDEPYLAVRQAFDSLRRQLDAHHARALERRTRGTHLSREA